MASFTINVSDELLAVAKVRAAKSGCSDLEQFVVQLITGEAAGGPEGLAVHSDRDIESILESRLNGPFVPMDAADFQQMREKLRSKLDTMEGRS